MLILGRKQGSKVTITTPSGETIVVLVAEIRGDLVRLGFEADNDVKIMRNELLPNGGEPC